jgi:hypothetical protein
MMSWTSWATRVRCLSMLFERTRTLGVMGLQHVVVICWDCRAHIYLSDKTQLNKPTISVQPTVFVSVVERIIAMRDGTCMGTRFLGRDRRSWKEILVW